MVNSENPHRADSSHVIGTDKRRQKQNNVRLNKTIAMENSRLLGGQHKLLFATRPTMLTRNS